MAPLPISIFVIAKNEADRLPRTLEAVRGLSDDLVVVDSGSTDRTCDIAREFGAEVYQANDILSHLDQYKGKGENLWKALYLLRGDIIVYVDADIKNIHPRFVYGLLGPLIQDCRVHYVKAPCRHHVRHGRWFGLRGGNLRPGQPPG